MKTFSWTVLAVIAILGLTDVYGRSIDEPTPTTSIPEAKAVSEAVDAAAEILTAEAVEEVVEKAIDSEIQKEADAQKKAVHEALKAAETEAVKEIVENASRPKPVHVKTNLNIPVPTLEFETGRGDRDNEISGTRDKRTIGQIGRMATCLFTILINPNCFNEIRSSGGSGGGLFGGLLGGRRSSSTTSSRQQAYNRQLRQWMEYQKRQIAKLNATEGGNYTTPFPILPPTPPAEEDEETTQRPGIFSSILQFKLNLIPNLFRTARSLFSSILPFLQNLGGGGGGGGLLSSLSGLGGGSSGSGSFGNYDSGSSYRPSSSLSSSSDSLSSSGSSSDSGAESSTYRISLG